MFCFSTIIFSEIGLLSMTDQNHTYHGHVECFVILIVVYPWARLTSTMGKDDFLWGDRFWNFRLIGAFYPMIPSWENTKLIILEIFLKLCLRITSRTFTFLCLRVGEKTQGIVSETITVLSSSFTFSEMYSDSNLF